MNVNIRLTIFEMSIQESTCIPTFFGVLKDTKDTLRKLGISVPQKLVPEFTRGESQTVFFLVRPK